MKIGLIDVDGHNFPNLALMKISSYHKGLGDDVEFLNSFSSYDKVYKSKVFTFTEDYPFYINCNEIIQGGTGYSDYNTTLPEEIEHIFPDYSLYNYKSAMGFLTRGCPNKCSFCVVPSKEGNIKKNTDIEEFWNGQKEAVLLDNNVLTHDHGLMQIEKIIKLGIKIDFNQGLDARIISRNIYIAELLSKVKWIRFIRLACDTKSQIPYIRKASENLNKFGLKNYKIFVYVLIKDIQDAYDRIIFLKENGLIPFAQPYIDFSGKTKVTKEQKRLARWVNQKAVFNSIEFKDYKYGK